MEPVLLLPSSVTRKCKSFIGCGNSSKACFGIKIYSYGHLEILPGIGGLGNFSWKYDIVLGHCRKKAEH